jgi:hypothetical protein
LTLLDKVCVGRASALPHDLLDECIARFDSDDVSCKWHALVQCILLISFCPCNSAGQSACLVSRKSGVRISPGAPFLFPNGAAVAQLTVNQLVGGSNPS